MKPRSYEAFWSAIAWMAAHCGEPALVPPKRLQPPKMRTSTPWRTAALYDTSGTPRCLPPWIVPCWYDGSSYKTLNPPPVAPKSGSFHAISPSYVPVSYTHLRAHETVLD